MTALSETVRELNSLRFKHGPQSPIGRRCSNIIEQVGNYRDAETPDQQTALAALIADQQAHLALLIAGGRQAGEA